MSILLCLLSWILKVAVIGSQYYLITQFLIPTVSFEVVLVPIIFHPAATSAWRPFVSCCSGVTGIQSPLRNVLGTPLPTFCHCSSVYHSAYTMSCTHWFTYSASLSCAISCKGRSFVSSAPSLTVGVEVELILNIRWSEGWSYWISLVSFWMFTRK